MIFEQPLGPPGGPEPARPAGGASPASAPRRSRRDPSEKPLSILVADDEHLVAIELAFSLGALGHSVVGPVADGRAAVEAARRHLPDMALLDIRMPGLDGLSAAREMGGALDIPCVIISAYSEAEYIRAAGSFGAVGYLVKPIQDDQLRVCIDLAWRRFCVHTVGRMEVRSLRKRLEDRKLIEQAKWRLVQAGGFTERQAHALLTSYARDTRQPVARVALAVVRKGLDIPG